MKRSRIKLYLLGTVAMLSLLPLAAMATASEMRIHVSVPHPNMPNETLTTHVGIGLDDRATDRFDTAWDAVAIPGGFVQAYIAHPEYDPATPILWRDTRASIGFPKEWNLVIYSSQAGVSVNLGWSATEVSGLPAHLRVRLVDLDNGNQEVDMRSVTQYTYLHADAATPHHFRVVVDEPVTTPPPGDAPPPTEPPPSENPPLDTQPAVTILTERLPVGILHKPYTATLEAQGGTAPYRWEIVSGGLPKGLKLDAATGVISGKPRRLGHYLFTIRLTDAKGNGLTARKDLTLSILRRIPSHRK